MSATEVSAVTLRALEILSNHLDAPQMPLQVAITFLHVATRGEVHMSDLEQLVGLSKPTLSRTVAMLGRGINLDKPGYNLVQTAEDLQNRKYKIVTLTEAGKSLLKEVEKKGGAWKRLQESREEN